MSAVSGYAWAPCTCDFWGCAKCAPVIIPKRLRVNLKSEEDWERTTRALDVRLVNDAHVVALQERAQPHVYVRAVYPWERRR